MTKLVNDPDRFARDALAGFATANAEHVVLLDGGVVRASASPADQVALVLGGGSGHFPAFAGWVGPGMAHGAACGNVFASPSQTQVLEVARAADNGAGVLFLPINYAGDILHFSAAADDLRAAGHLAEMVAITDDIASGPPGRRTDRRGIAGSFLVVKVVGAAAERGRSLAELTEVAERINGLTATFGVALSGCTLPGAATPLFEVPEGRIAVGLGIHGEPGIAERDLGSADDVADLLLDGLLAEVAPPAGAAVAVLVNGLGSTTPDELHVVFARVHDRLTAGGFRIVAPVVGELVSSLDMAGVSLSMAVLDDELEELWTDPAEAPCFRRGLATPRPRRARLALPASTEAAPAPASPASTELAAAVAGALADVAGALAAADQRLGEIDAVAGDGDHGIGMRRGSAAAAEAAAALAGRAGAGTTMRAAGAAWSDVGGGTSGALWGAGIAAAADVVGDDEVPDPGRLVETVAAFAAAVVERGGAAVGDKTMVDAIEPFARAFAEEIGDGREIAAAWRAATEAARNGAEGTVGFSAKKGRSKLHADRSLGTPDAGAVSFVLVVEAIGARLTGR
ncbi:L-erythrulose 1-kinase [Nocardioides hungaricus]